MYDISESEESNLPLPKGWIRAIDTSGCQLYKDMRMGVESEEHPYIIQALDAARKLPLPPGWVVKETYLSDGEKDYFYSNSSLNQSGWDPPQLRECLSHCLFRDGYSGAANSILKQRSGESMIKSDTLGSNEAEDMSSSDSEPEPVSLHPYSNISSSQKMAEESTSSAQENRQSASPQTEEPVNSGGGGVLSDAKSVDWMQLMQHLGNLEDIDRSRSVGERMPPVYTPDEGTHSFEPTGDDMERAGEQFDGDTSKTDIESVYSRTGESVSMSLASRRSKRSQKWMDIRASHMTPRKPPSSVASTRSRNRAMKHPEAVSALGVRSLAAGLLESNEQVHQLMVELRVMLAKKRDIRCRVLAQTKDRECSEYGDADDVHSPGVINELVSIAQHLVDVVRNQPEILVAAMSAMPVDSPEATLLAFTALHRVLHPYSADSSSTTALLLESLNAEIERVCNDIEESVLFTNPNGLQVLLCRLLANFKIESGMSCFTPLECPLFSNPSGNELNGKIPRSPTILSILLKSYGIRRDISSFYRMIWKPVMPAIVAMTDSNSTYGDLPASSSPVVVTFTKLISLAGRIVECGFLDEVVMVFPATATALARCFAEICGRDGTYTYILEFLILPNIIKLILGENDSADNEDTFKHPYLSQLASKYYDHRSWWPVKGSSYVESENYSTVQIVDSAGMLIWCVWRIFSIAVYSHPSAITTLTAKEFFAPIDINPVYTGVANTKLRSIVSRMRLKINKGCERLLQLPLDNEGTSFLEIEPDCELQQLEFHTRSMMGTLRSRLESLMMKPDEALNATVISRHDSMILFDSIAFAFEEQLNEMRNALDPEEIQYHESYYFLVDLHEEIQDYLRMCDLLDEAAEEADEEYEDIMFLWRTISPRVISDNQSEASFTVSSAPMVGANNTLNNHTRNGELGVADLTGESVPGYFDDESGYPPPPDHQNDDDSTLVSNFPPPPLPPPSEVEYQYDQLVRSQTLAFRYIESLKAMMSRVSLRKKNSVRYLLEDETWYSYPEVDVSNMLAAPETDMYDKTTLSVMNKMRSSHYGLGNHRTSDARTDDSFVPLVDKHNEFFASLRFNNPSASAGANTSVDTYAHKAPVRYVNNLMRPSLRSLNISINTEPKKGSTVSRSTVSRNATAKHTRVVLPESSSLLVPTKSYAQQPAKRKTLNDVGKDFVHTLRSPIEVSKSSRSVRSVKARTIDTSDRHSTAIPFPEHLRSRVRGNPSVMDEPIENRYSGDIPSNVTARRYSNPSADTTSGHKNYNFMKRKLDRKMPEPVSNMPKTVFEPTESRSRQMHAESDDNTVITKEQEKGWKSLLRHHDSSSECGSIRQKPFKPSGSVSPASMRKQRRRAPDNRTSGRRHSRSRSRERFRQHLADDRPTRYSGDSSYMSRRYDQEHYRDSHDHGGRFFKSNEYVEGTQQSDSESVDPIDVSDFCGVFNDIVNSKELNLQKRLKARSSSKISDKSSTHSIAESIDDNSRRHSDYASMNSASATFPSVSTDISFKGSESNTRSHVVLKSDVEDLKDDDESKNSDSIPCMLEDTSAEKPTLRVLNRRLESKESSATERTSPKREDSSSSSSSKQSIEDGSGHASAMQRLNSSASGTGLVKTDAEIDNDDVYESKSTDDDHGGVKDKQTEDATEYPLEVPVVQRQHSMSKTALREKLMNGYEVVKHGVSGYPKSKLVFYDPSVEEISWKSSNKDSFTLFRSRSQLEKSIKMADITEVRKGVQTKVLLKGGLLDPARCLSIITANRTLDMVFSSTRERDLFHRTMSILLESYPDVLFLS